MPFTLVLAALVAAPPSLLTTTIRDSLEASVVRVLPHEGPALSAEVARLLRWRGDVNKDVHRGDLLEVLYSLGPGEPELLALNFQGSEMSLRAYRYHGADGIDRYYDENGVLVEPQMLNTPVPGYVQITEIVQHGRGRRQHKGIDLKAPEGSPIRLPFAGTVVRTNWAQRVNGHCIEVEYEDGSRARFLHMLQIDPTVHAGVRLQVGAPLGEVGNTGHSNAAHLHYEIIGLSGKPLEPLDIHGRRTVRLDAVASASYKQARDALDRQLRGPTVVGPMEFSAYCGPMVTEGQSPLRCQAQANP